MQLTVTSREKTQLIDITRQIQDLIQDRGITSGVCHIFVPHTHGGGYHQ